MKQRPLHIFLVAGESSGDFLGANLMRALKDQYGNVEFSGVGGRQMAEEGLLSLFPMEELSIMGIAEVLPKLLRILKRIHQVSREIVKLRPDALITIDSPDFCFRVIQRVRARIKSIPCIHYVAPSVWAWRPGRAKRVAQFLDHLLALLPFEPPYFEPHGLKTSFVGHPVVERLSQRGDGSRFRRKYGIRETQPILCLLPGSRMSEISRLLEKFSQTADIILRKKPDIAVVIPTLPHLKRHIEQFFTGRGINPVLVDNDEDKFDCFSASTAALAASGTVSLELALADTPHIIAYRLSALSAFLAKYLVKTPYANLINILLKRQVVPELLQDQCTPELMSQAILRLLEQKDARTAQLMDFREALIKLGLGDPETPGQRAARAVLSVVEKAGGGRPW